MDYKGKLHETAARFEQTEIWIDSCGEDELDYALARSCSGATSNPAIVGNVVKKELSRWAPVIEALIAEKRSATEDDIAWELIYAMGRERSKKLLPLFERYGGKKGRLSIQTNPKLYRNQEKMLAQARLLNSLGENLQVKLPASQAGVKAMEEATFQGISINATVSFTVAQAVAVAQAVERGLNRRTAAGLPADSMSPVCTVMIGRTDDYMRACVKQDGILLNPECLDWAGVAVIKEAYRIYKARGYRTRLLSAAYRNHYHWSQLVGGELSMTIPFDWHQKINACGIAVKDRMDMPVREEYLSELNKLEAFRQSFHEDGLAIEDFEHYGGFRATISGFLGGYDDLVKVIRGYMNP